MIYTARGPIHNSELGITLSHEHIKWEYDECHANNMYFDKKYREEEIELDAKMILPIMLDIKAKGGKSVVETTPPIGGQNVRLLKLLSERADMHIIPCTGWNHTKQLYEVFPHQFEEQLSSRWIKDFKNGLDTVDGVLIRPGYIKLLLDKGGHTKAELSKVDLSKADRAMLVAAVKASNETGMPIHCHILEAEMVYTVMDLLDSEKMDYNKFLWAHADEESHLDTIKRAAEKGMWLGIDNVRKGTSPERFELLKHVISLGYGNKVLLSQDYEFFSEAKRAEEIQAEEIRPVVDHPCTVIFDEFMPYCVENGLDEEEIIRIMTENPATFYDFEPQV